MAGRQICQLHPTNGKQPVPTGEKRVVAIACKNCEGRVDLPTSAGIQHVDLHSHDASCRLHVSQRGLGKHRIGWIDKHCNTNRPRHQFTQKLQPLGPHRTCQETNAREIAVGPREVGYQTEANRVSTAGEDNWYRRRRRLGCERLRGASRDDYYDLSTSQLGSELWQLIVLIVRPAVFDGDVLALDITGSPEALAECAHTVRKPFRRSEVEDSNHRRRRLLRARRKRPRYRRAAQQRDELAPSHAVPPLKRTDSV